MANRFLDTNYYKSPFVRSLQGALKSLYSFIICDCDGAGIWNLDLPAASLYIGFEINMLDFDEHFIKKDKAISIGGLKYFFPDFIEHQYPSGLQEKNPAHKNAIKTLKKFDLIDEFLNVKKKGALKGLNRSIGYGNGYDKDMVMEKNKETDEFDFVPNLNFPIPKMQQIWMRYKPDYSHDVKRDFTPLQSIWTFISKQDKVKKDKRPEEEKILEAFEFISKYVSTHDFFKTYSLKQIDTHIQSIIQNIQQNGTSKSKQATGKDVNVQSAFDAIDKFHAKNGVAKS